jgi:hypothetical protein
MGNLQFNRLNLVYGGFKMSKNKIAPELLSKIGRLPGMRYVFNDRDGHVLITENPLGTADRVLVFGKNKESLNNLHAAVMAVEGVLAHMGYEDPASGNIHPWRWVHVRWSRQELIDAGVNLDGFHQHLVEQGNLFIEYTQSRYFTRQVRYDDDPETIHVVKFCRDHTAEEGDDVFMYGMSPDQAIPGIRNEFLGWEIVGF